MLADQVDVIAVCEVVNELDEVLGCSGGLEYLQLVHRESLDLGATCFRHHLELQRFFSEFVLYEPAFAHIVIRKLPRDGVLVDPLAEVLRLEYNVYPRLQVGKAQEVKFAVSSLRG